ncbi:MAG: helix-hairpin-helix domain-containing protein [Deltaproteobacteria bacterium]|nr:MAG: helix-hairpin-helix domain-containing protein [Deltaproteobacteria bacterium]
MTHRSRSLRAWLVVLATCLLAASYARAADGGVDPNGVVNVNTATLEELQLLPGIGETRARAILSARESRGAFKSIDELLEVKGIGPSGLEKLRARAVVSGKTTARTP